MTLPDGPARNYLALALGSLLLWALMLSFRVNGNLLLACVPVLLALVGLLARFNLFPILGVVSTCYLLVYPMGIPRYPAIDLVPVSHFRLLDLAQVGSVLVYLVAMYRLKSLSSQAMPVDQVNVSTRQTEPPIHRSDSAVSEAEFPWIFVQVGVCLVLGQVFWFLLSELRAVPSEFPPIRLGTTLEMTYRPNPGSAFLLCSGLFIASFLGALLLFWYWRWNNLTPLEARQLLLDIQWGDARREMNRQEHWRAWALPKPQPMKPVPLPNEKSGCSSRRNIFRLLLIFGMLAVGTCAFWIGLAYYLIRRL